MKKSAICCFLALAFIGIILIAVSMAGFAYFPPLIQSQVFKNLDLADLESEGFKNFVSKNTEWYYDTLYFIGVFYPSFKIE